MSYTPLSNLGSKTTTSRSTSRSPSRKRVRWNRTTVHDRFLTTDYWRDESLHGEDSGSDVELDELAESLGPAFRSSKRKHFRSHLLAKLWKKCQTVTLLLLLGIFVAVITFTMDKTVSSLENAKLSLLLTTIATNSTTETTTKTTTFTSMLLYLFVSLTLAIVALALVRLVPMATGSGIPRMKSLFSGGIYFHYFLSWRTLFVKTVGLTCAYAAGLTVGKEGPFVHIAACVATLLTRFSPFKRYADVSRLRHGLLATACATGVVAAFGCPFGGIIFAIEAVSTYFVVRSLPHMFISTTVASVCLRFFDPSQYSPLGTLNDETNDIKYRDTSFMTVLQSIFIGLTCGLMSGAFTRSHVFLAKRYKNNRSSVVAWCCVAAAMILEVVILISYVETFPEIETQGKLLKTMFQSSWSSDGHSTVFATYCACKVITALLCSVLELPTGLYSPVFLIGALYGRSFGELMSFMKLPGTQLSAADFAVLGAASMTGGTFRAISTAVIVLELTGDLTLQLPVAVSVVSAYFIANRLSPPLYDVLTKLSAVAHVPELPAELRQDPIQKWMRPIETNEIVTPQFDVRDCIEILSSCPDALVFPVVKSKSDYKILGDVQRRDVERTVDSASKRDGVLRRRGTGEDDEDDEDESCSRIKEKQFQLVFKDPIVGEWRGGEGFRRRGRHRAASSNENKENKNNDEEKSTIVLTFDAAPFQVSHTAPLSRVYMLFHMLRLARIYCVSQGTLVGIVTREDLMKAIPERSGTSRTRRDEGQGDWAPVRVCAHVFMDLYRECVSGWRYLRFGSRTSLNQPWLEENDGIVVDDEKNGDELDEVAL